jgi:hypothetical protein
MTPRPSAADKPIASALNTPVIASHSACGLSTLSKAASIFVGPLCFIGARKTPP